MLPARFLKFISICSVRGQIFLVGIQRLMPSLEGVDFLARYQPENVLILQF